MQSGLYIVGTPIGNLSDMSLFGAKVRWMQKNYRTKWCWPELRC